MASRADQIRANAAKFSGSPPEQARPAPVAEPEDLDRAAELARQNRVVRTRRVRRTVDLPPARHHALTEWSQEVALNLGVARVTGQDVINELVHLLLTDETTANKIRAALRKALDDEGR